MRFNLTPGIIALAASTVAVNPAAAADIAGTSKVEAVTVFLSGAEITRVGRVKIDKGEHTVVFGDVPASAVPGSIRVEGKATGKLDIVSVDSRRTYIPSSSAAITGAERKKLEDDIMALRDRRLIVEGEITAAATQQQLIAKLAELPTRPAPPNGAADAIEDWTRILAVIAAGTTEAVKITQAANVQLRDIDRQINDLEGRLASLAPQQSEQTEIKVFVKALTPLDADLSIRYQVQEASWAPVYDARLATGSKTDAPKLDLTRRAELRQSTGEAWTDVTVQLSTTRPASGAAAPELYTQTVDFEDPANMAELAKSKRRMTTRSMDSDGMGAGVVAEAAPEAPAMAMPAPPPVAVGQSHATLTVAPFQATFAVPGRLTIPATNEAKRVTLSADAIEPTLAIRTVPKSVASAYLYAKFLLPKGSPTLPGPVYLFRDGTFVGTGDLPVLSPGEEHEIGFGVDDQVRVRHAIVDEQRGETGLISSSRTDSRNYRVTVKNLHERPVDLVVYDQIPVALNQDIKVEYTGKAQPAKTDADDKRGILTFESTLDPEEEEIIEFGYRITWPAAKSIQFN